MEVLQGKAAAGVQIASLLNLGQCPEHLIPGKGGPAVLHGFEVVIKGKMMSGDKP